MLFDFRRSANLILKESDSSCRWTAIFKERVFDRNSSGELLAAVDFSIEVSMPHFCGSTEDRCYLPDLTAFRDGLRELLKKEAQEAQFNGLAASSICVYRNPRRLDYFISKGLVAFPHIRWNVDVAAENRPMTSSVETANERRWAYEVDQTALI